MYSIAEYIDSVRSLERGITRVRVAGQTLLGRDIYAIEKGDSRYGTILIHGSIHAREYIVTPLLIEMMREYSGRARVVMLPMVNVDGVALVLEGASSVRDRARREWLLGINGSDDFSLWKANANAVDLNVNYDAGWGMGASNIRYPAPQNHIGPRPMSEVENMVLAGETLENTPIITLSYHTKGAVVYEGYGDKIPFQNEALRIADYLGYDLELSTGSHGGYKDWYIERYGGLGLTIECGDDSLMHPIGIEHIDRLLDTHMGLLEVVGDMAERIGRR